MFKVSNRVSVIARPWKTGIVVELGLRNSQGTRWVRVKFGKSSRWILEDGLRLASRPLMIPIPNGVIVSSKGQWFKPEVLRQPNSTASDEELVKFATTLFQMWESHKSNRK